MGVYWLIQALGHVLFNTHFWVSSLRKTESVLENTLCKVRGTWRVKTKYITFKNWIMHCTALYCTVLHCIALYCTALSYSTQLYWSVLSLYWDERRDIRWNIAWAWGKSRGWSPRDFPRALAIFHRISRLESQYRHSQLGKVSTKKNHWIFDRLRFFFSMAVFLLIELFNMVWNRYCKIFGLFWPWKP